MADKGRVYCDHCDTWVSKRTQREHRLLAQDLANRGKRTWKRYVMTYFTLLLTLVFVKLKTEFTNIIDFEN
jgi:uncharacterized membrane protein YvbJ